ncbi:MAG: hypothetical protein HY370_09150 [Proteobacteria bacterium]|nr:hypothetical protein [Pseudomonadota bacterium]
MKIGKKQDLWHLIRMGKLVKIDIDFETTSLIRNFSQVTSYGDALGDIAGNFAGSEEISVRLQERYLPSPEALLVTQTRYRELRSPERADHAKAMGLIAQRFENAVDQVFNALNLEKKEVTFTTVRRAGRDDYKKKVTEKVIEYPLLNEDGQTVYDVRYHPERKKIAYRFSEDPKSPYYENFENSYYTDEYGQKWRWTDPRLEVGGFRIKWADLYWLRVNMVRAGIHPSNAFFAYSKASISNKERPKNFAVDGSTVAINTHLFGPVGEDSLKLGERIDPQFGGGVVSARLESIMQANTRYANKARGIRGGILMPDGTLYDRNRGHRSPAYDAKASFALYNYCREIAPDVVRRMEEQTDEKELRRILPGSDMTDSRPPLYAMPRNDYPHGPIADPVLHIALDDREGNFRREILMRMDINLRSYERRGKKLTQMSSADFYALMKNARAPDSVLRVESLRRWPGVTRLEDALETSAGRKWDMNALRDTAEGNFNFINENPEIIMRIRGAAARMNRDAFLRAERENPMMEEQFINSGFGDLDYLRQETKQERQARLKGKPLPDRGAMPGFFDMLYNKAQIEYRFFNMVEEGLHRLALHPLPVDYSDSAEAVENFGDLCRRMKQKFRKKNVPFHSTLFRDLVDDEDCEDRQGSADVLSPLNVEKARAFRWSLRQRLLEDAAAAAADKTAAYSRGLMDYEEMNKGRILFPNIDRNCDYRIVDKKGRVLPIDYLHRLYQKNPKMVRDRLDKRVWRIQFYRMSSDPSVNVTLNLFDIGGRLNELSPAWQKRYETLTRISLNGPPNEDPSNARWYTIGKAEQEIKRLEVNASLREGGEGVSRSYSDYADGKAEAYARTDLGQRIIGEYIEDIGALKEKYRLDEKFAFAARYDPKSGLPYDYIEYEIPAENHVVIDLPDAHIRRPVEDARFVPFAFIAGRISENDRKKVEEGGAAAVLRGQQTGRMYYAGPVSFSKAPPESPAYSDMYERARHAYVQEAGVKFPGRDRRTLMIAQQPVPLAHTRRNIDPAMQTVKVPALYFDALVSPRMGFFRDNEPITGLVLPVDCCPQEMTVDRKIRFREMDAPMMAGLKGIERVETGHIYESRLRNLRRARVREVLEDINSGAIKDSRARRYGFAGAVDMGDKIRDAFMTHESVDPLNEEVYLLEFDVVDKKTWAYWNPMYAPDAAMTWKGQPVPPSAYRWFNAQAANDPGVKPEYAADTSSLSSAPPRKKAEGGKRGGRKPPSL